MTANSSDQELIALVRAGDLAALGELYERHHEAGLRVARAVTGEGHRAQDLVSDAFERIHGAIARGAGPDESFRAYLYTVIRRLAAEEGADRARAEPTDDFAPYEAITAVDDGTEHGVEAAIVASAFAALAPRHQAVLWYVDVEGMPTAEAAAFFGLSANATAALANRARAALKESYLQAHVSGTGVRAACVPVRGMLGGYRAGSLSARDTAKVDAHLADCDECPVVLVELADVSHGLRAIIAPLVIGGAAAAALLATPPEAASAAAITGPRRGASRSTTVAAAILAALAIGAVTVSAVAGSTGTSVAEGAGGGGAGAGTEVVGPVVTPTKTAILPTSPPPTAGATGTALPKADARTRRPSSSTPGPSTPSAAPALTAAFSDAGDLVRGRGGVVAIEIANAGGPGGAATLEITLPDGAVPDGAARPLTSTGSVAWTCVASVTTISCTAPSVPAGARATVYAPVSVAADAPLGARPSAALAVAGAPTITAVATASVMDEGLGTRFLADGALEVVHAGASLLTCDPALPGCVDARRRVPGSDLNNNQWAMVLADGAGLGAPSSSARLTLGSGAVVRFAGLYWSGDAPATASDVDIASATLTGPGTGAAAVPVHASMVERNGATYLAFADVTARLAADGGGTWSFGGASIVGGVGAAAGWSLVVVVEDAALAPSRVAVFDGLETIGGASSASFSLPSVAGGQVEVGAVAWEGDAGIAGDRVLVDGVALVRAASGTSDNVFASFADGAVPPCDPADAGCADETNGFGFDAGAFVPVSATGDRVRVEVVSSSDYLDLGVLTLTTR